ncbi:hypothetical protein ACHAXS_006987 [Conticribra weissflogii]
MTSSSSSSNPTLDKPFYNNHFENPPHTACVSLFHRNGRVGCGTWDRNVMTGRLLLWDSVIDKNENNGDENSGRKLERARDVAPYVAVMDEADYTAENVALLLSYSASFVAGDQYGKADQGGPLRGVLVLTSSQSDNSNAANAGNGGSIMQSPEPLTPQGDETPMASLTVGSSYEWNAPNKGDGLTMTDMYGLPTAYVYDNSTAQYLRNVATDQAATVVNGNDMNAAIFPSVVSEFNYYMGPGNNGEEIFTSKSCLEWKDTDGKWSPKCLPLGGNSVWAVAGSPISGVPGREENENNNNNNERPTILLATSIDSTSMFHEISPGANTAASNILALLLAAELIGSSIQDDVIDGLYGRIAFAFFQGESYGFIGSRLFLKDVVEGFACKGGDEGVASVYKRREDETTTRACLNPLRADLSFQNLGKIRGMIAVDQVGNLGGEKDFYVQGGQNSVANGDGGFEGFLAEVMLELSDRVNQNDGNNGGDVGYTVQSSSVTADEDNIYPLPPTPLSSLVQLSGGAIGGVVLTGYDDAFVTNSLYHSHLDSVRSGIQSIDKDAIAAAATIIARTAVAAAHQNENEEVDAATAAAYALELLPNSATSSSETFQSLFTCLFEDGNCDVFLKYASVERENDAKRTGVDLGLGDSLGTPPSYYTSIYNQNSGQACVVASGKWYGAMSVSDSNEKEIKMYGESESDTFLLRASLLETSIFGYLNNFLGKGSISDQEGDDGSSVEKLKSCNSSSDCTSVTYCSSETSQPTCAGGSCICGSRSHYHPALDEAIAPATNKFPGYFEVDGNDEGISAMFTEPFWSSDVGVRIYRDAGNKPGIMASSLGAVFCVACICAVYRLKKKLVKEKVY